MNQEEALRLLRGGREGIREWNHRRKDGEDVPDLSGIDLSGAALAGAMLGGVQLSNADLHAADLNNADLQAAVLIGANLRCADLHDARLSHASLVAADLRNANLSGADLGSTHLIQACIASARCSQARFHAADLSHADLQGANLTGADLSKATLIEADLTGVSLKSANLDQACVTGVRYDRRRLSCRGIRVDGCYGNAVFRRDVQDEDWIETFRAQSRRHYVLWFLWWLFTDCGRSILRAWLAALVLVMCFGAVYDRFPELLNTSRSAGTVWTPYYFSFVTFSTLGFGDVSPGSLVGEVLVTAEVILGYVTLGVLVSILANKVARRS
ncbi:MAG TPA: pentapeptide repeat-containing protein [Phycisphaerae bacterium]|nr:pentapeptide repeat-containing protein [Phycisphaerae bacterium]